MPFAIRTVCPQFVGRQEEVAVLRAQLDLARAGAGGTVLISGEAGLGKSRLLAELRNTVTPDQVQFLQGRCFESERTLPFSPFLDMVQSHVAEQSHDPFSAELQAFTAGLGTVTPALISGDTGSGNTQMPDPQQHRQQACRSFVNLLTRLSSSRPVVLVIEDVHWIDEATLECIASVAQRIHLLPCLLVLTLRRDDAPPGVLHVLAELDRRRSALEVELAPFALSDVNAMVRAIFGLKRPPRPAFVQALHERTGGNPFFVEEIIAALVALGEIYPADDGWERRRLEDLRVSRTVQDAVRWRVGQLTKTGHKVLTHAAVIGQRFEFALLADLTDLSESELLPGMKELIDASFVVEESADRFVFRHALIRKAVEQELLARERMVIHRRVVSSLARLAGEHPDQYLDDLSRHAFAAESWSAALHHSARAGTRALSLGAPYAAIVHFDRAQESARMLEAELSFDVIWGRGRACDMIGDFEAAARDYDRALKTAERAGDGAGVWQVHHDLGLLWCSRDYDVALGWFQRALAISRASNDDRRLAQSLNRMGNWLANNEQPDPAMTNHQEALQIFRRIGDRPGEAATFDLMAMAASLGGDIVSASMYNERAIRVFRELGDVVGEAGNMGVNGPNGIYDLNMLVGIGTLNGMIDHARRATRLAHESGWTSGEAMAGAMLGEALIVRGAFDDGRKSLDEALALAESIDHQQWMVQALWGLANAHLDMGNVPSAIARLERALDIAETVHSANFVIALRARHCIALLSTGALDDVERTLEGLLVSTVPMRTQGQRHLWYALAELRQAQGRAREAGSVIDRLFASAQNLTSEGDIPYLALLKSRVLSTLGESKRTERLLGDALRTATYQGAQTVMFAIHAAMASNFAAAGDTSGVTGEIAAARELIDRLSSSLADEEQRSAYIRWAEGQLPVDRQASAAHRPGNPWGLTRRELEVAVLLVEGLSNRDIADRLFVGERTAEAHVGSIMRKLGFNSRVQVAMWAVERGILRPTT